MRFYAVLVLLLIGPLLAGCLQDGPGIEVHLLITEGFGTSRVHEGVYLMPAGSTAMDLLYEATRGDLELAFGGGFVVAMFDRRGSSGDEPTDWFYEVDGVHQGVGAAQVRLHDGSRVHWDLRAWRTPLDVPGLFGSFPAGGLAGRTPDEAPWELMPFVSLDGDDLVTPAGVLTAPWGLVIRTFPESSANAVAVDGGMAPPLPRLCLGVARNQTMEFEIVPW